jgi:hypothetical protein
LDLRGEKDKGLEKLYREAFYDFYFSSDIVLAIKSRIMTWVGHASRMGERHAQELLVGGHKGKRILVRPRHRFEGNKNVSYRNRMGERRLNLSS